MKHNYVIICLDSMFETFLVADEFEFLRIRDVFDISVPKTYSGSEITRWVYVFVLWVLNSVCYVSFCNVSRSINEHFLFVVSFSNHESMLYHGNG